MSSYEVTSPAHPEAPKPNDPELFGSILKQMIDITHQGGYDFPATAYTDEDLELFSQYGEGGLPSIYSTARCIPGYLAHEGLTNDSKGNYGYISRDPSERRMIHVAVLGEGPSIKYGEFGRLLVWDNHSDDDNTHYAFRCDGTVMMAAGISDHETVMYYADEPYQATDEELRQLEDDLKYWHSGKPTLADA